MVRLFFIISLALLLRASDGFPTTLHSTFMYRYCSTANRDGTPTFSDARESLLEQLRPRSSQSKFYRTAVVIPDRQSALWGQFQCRGDLTAHECYTCVNHSLSNISLSSWCADSLAARIQLSGCHVQYEADGSEIPGADLTHSTCGEVSEGVGASAAAEALAAVESGVVENPSGYCSVNVGGVYAAAQCAEGLSGCDCGECVAKAAQECTGSLSGHVYMDLCFLSFEFHLHPATGSSPANSNPAGRGIGSSGKLVAIAAGGAALLLIGFLLLNKLFYKDDD